MKDYATNKSAKENSHLISPPKLDNFNSQANMIDDSSSILFENIKNQDRKLMIELKHKRNTPKKQQHMDFKDDKEPFRPS